MINKKPRREFTVRNVTNEISSIKKLGKGVLGREKWAHEGVEKSNGSGYAC